MSGGYFNYDQYRIRQISDSVDDLIEKNDSQDLGDYGCKIGKNYAPEVIEKFRKGLAYLRIAEVYAQRIDWLVSGDDGEDAFMQRLADDLYKLGEVVE